MGSFWPQWKPCLRGVPELNIIVLYSVYLVFQIKGYTVCFFALKAWFLQRAPNFGQQKAIQGPATPKKHPAVFSGRQSHNGKQKKDL